MSFVFISVVVASFSIGSSLLAAEKGKPLKIYLLAGQSNMSGYGNLRTLDYMKHDPVSVPILNEIQDENGKARIIDGVWISEPHKSGQLTTGFGANRGGTQNRSGTHLWHLPQKTNQGTFPDH